MKYFYKESNMKLVLFIASVFSVIVSCSVYKVNNPYDTYFIKGKNYHYNTYCIDSIGDTLHKGKFVIAPKNKPWIAQLNHQESVNYYYTSDDKGLKKKNKDPFIYYWIKPKKLYKENTGGYLNENAFYIHPPRSDVFTLLFHSAHPCMVIQLLDRKEYDSFSYDLSLYGLGILNSSYKIHKISRSSLASVPDTMKVWGVTVNSKIEFKDSTKIRYTGLLNSRLDAEYSRELTYIKLHHTFENGTKIHFNFEKMTEKNN
jgi:hypothetical protein